MFSRDAEAIPTAATDIDNEGYASSHDRDVGSQAQTRVERLEDVAEENRRLREALSRKEDILAGLAEELRSPMTAILEWVNLVREGHITRDSLEWALENIEISAQLQNNLIQDMLDLYQAEQGTLEMDSVRLDVRDQIKRAVAAVAPFAAACGVSVVAVTPDSACEIVGDSGKIRQILIKVLLSAVDATSSLGVIFLRCKHDHGNIQIALGEDSEIDDSCAPRHAKTLLGLDRGRSRGSGTLLTIDLLRKLAELQGGKLAMRNANNDTRETFFLGFPMVPPDAEETA